MSPLVQLLGWAVLHALWEACLLGALAAGVGRLLPCRTRHGLDLLLLGLCVVAPVLTAWHFQHPSLPAPAFAPGGLDATVAASLSVPEPMAGPFGWRWQAALQAHLSLVATLWGVGAGFMALRLAGGYAFGAHRRRQGLEAPAPWQEVVDRLAEGMGLSRRVRLLGTTWGVSPMVVGLWKPAVLLPLVLVSHLPPDHLEALLAHELAHLRRLDPLLTFFQGVVEVLLFFHPVVWWLSARIRADREELADALAAQNLGEPRRLALALNALDDLQTAFPPHPFPALAAGGGHLLTRIQRLLSPRPAAGSPWGLLSLALIPCAALALRAALPSPTPIPVPAAALAQLDALAAQERLDPQLLRSMAWAESGFDPAARSSLGAMGLLQVMPQTARAYGAKDLNDPAQVLAAGARYLRVLLDHYHGDVRKAVAAYNCGEQAMDGGRMTDEAARYRALVMQVLSAKAVQPEAPLAEGEVQGVLRRIGNDRLLVQLRARVRGNLEMAFQAGDTGRELGTLRIGQ
ncbi:MAG TPA: transglycosylase SLT domain-containing protein, partial [Holophagaceae bacterium]